MDRTKPFAWAVVGVTTGVLVWQGAAAESFPPVTDILFWIALLVVAELLPVSLGFGAVVTMGFPIHIALAIVFRNQPLAAMLIAGLGALDIREIRRQIPLHIALFNRAVMVLSIGASLIPLTVFGANPLEHLSGAFVIILAALLHLIVDLGLVVVGISRREQEGFTTVLRSQLPKPVAGFAASYGLLTAYGVIAAFADRLGKWAVAAILVPLFFARLSILGARSQQQMAERIQEQQRSLLEATERVFQEREDERQRIAGDLHDSTLQGLAAAAFACGNAADHLGAGQIDQAAAAIKTSQHAVGEATDALRASLFDLRDTGAEGENLVAGMARFADQIATLWGADIEIRGSVVTQPPLPVLMAALQIAQEGVTNALKHSRTKKVSVTVGEEDGMVHITVEDQGSGFDPSSEAAEEHVGIRLMKERAARVGGRIQLESRPGTGTRVEAILPGGVAS